MVFTKLLLENALAIRPCNCGAASEPLLLKVARCIPVLPSRYVGKCAARVLKCSGYKRTYVLSEEALFYAHMRVILTDLQSNLFRSLYITKLYKRFRGLAVKSRHCTYLLFRTLSQLILSKIRSIQVCGSSLGLRKQPGPDEA